jgi:hypothetical protein
MSTYSAGYNFNPNDTVWILDNQTIKEGVCVQTNIMVVNNSSGVLQTTVTYLVLLNCNAGTMTVADADAFPTLEDALTALQTYLTNLVCSPAPTNLPAINKQDERSLNSYDNYEDLYCNRCCGK